jgi:tetratricopeptide (TPR) repeat protein
LVSPQEFTAPLGGYFAILAIQIHWNPPLFFIELGQLVAHNGSTLLDGGRGAQISWRGFEMQRPPRLNLIFSAWGLLMLLGAWVPGASAAGAEVPALIGLQPQAVQDAWRAVEIAIAENQKLDQPLPEPYFARGQIWALVGNHEAALRDYLTAVELAAASGRDLAAYAAYFQTLQQALENVDRVPKPPALGLARHHYARGVHAFWRGDLPAALRHFDNAVQLKPGAPLYWYYRAVTHKRLGSERRARHDALIGAHLEWRDGLPDQFGTALARLQGDLRQWLERHRLGDPARHMLEARR